MRDQITILLPHGESEEADGKLADRLPDLHGKRVGFVDNELWRSMHILVDELGETLKRDHGVSTTETIFLSPGAGALPKKYQEALQDLATRVDAVVTGLGN